VEGFNKLSSLPSIQRQLTLYRFIFRSLLKVIIISSNQRHIVCSCKQLLIIWKKNWHFNASRSKIDVRVLWLSLLKDYIGIFVPQTKFAWGHQILCNQGQRILIATMVDNIIQTNWNVTFYAKGIYNRLVSCKNYKKK